MKKEAKMVYMENFVKGMLPFWERLTDLERELILNSCAEERFARGNILNRSEEECRGAILLRDGQIRVYIVSEEGREVTLYRLHAGEVCVLSASCLLDSIVFDVIIEAVEDTEAVLIPASVLHQLTVENPYVELFLAKSANDRFSDVMWTMQQILFMGADRRVAVFLWDEISKTGSMELTYTHDEVARFIGSAREVVSRILRYFADEGVVRLSRGRIDVADKEKLHGYVIT